MKIPCYKHDVTKTATEAESWTRCSTGASSASGGHPVSDLSLTVHQVVGLLSTVRVPFDTHTLVFSCLVKCSPCHRDHLPLHSLSLSLSLISYLHRTVYGSSFSSRPHIHSDALRSALSRYVFPQSLHTIQNQVTHFVFTDSFI